MPDSTKGRPAGNMAPSSLTHLHTTGQDTHNNIDSSLQGPGPGPGTSNTHQATDSGIHHHQQPGTSTWYPIDALTSSSPSSSAYKRLSHPVTSATTSSTNTSQHYSTRQEHPTPLSIALPLSNSRTTINGSTPHHNNTPSGGGSFSAGYLDQRRDTFHTLSHHQNSTHTNGHINNSNGYSNSSISWQTYSANNNNNIHDDSHHNHHHAHTHHPQPMRPQSISYANHQLPLQMHHHQQQQQQSSYHVSPTTPTSASIIDQDPASTNAAIMRRRRLSTASTSSKRGGAGSSNNLRAQKAPNTPHHTRRFTTLISDQEPDTTYIWGYLLFFCTMVGFTVSMYALVASNYMPLTGNKVHSMCLCFVPLLWSKGHGLLFFFFCSWGFHH